MKVDVISTADLGDRSYLIAAGDTAVVVDPQRDIDRVETLLAERNLRCVVVLETHIHNDYVTGGFELARRTGAAYVVNAADPVSFERTAVVDGDTITAGPMTITAVATPGHTLSHLAYVITDPTDDSTAVFTGGSLLYGSVGRTDLLGDHLTRELTHHQFHSAHHLADLLDDATPVYPTHGFGSFCSAGSATGGDTSTIGEEKRINDALTTADEETFVDTLIANLTAYPAYYAHMGPANLAGPGPANLAAPSTLGPDELRKQLDAGEWVVDLRDRTAYASDHLAGTVSIALGTQFSTYLGWLMPWGSALTLIGDTPDDVTAAQRQLSRIGVDDLTGAAIGSLDQIAGDHEHSHYREVTFADPAFQPGSTLLDPEVTDRVVLDVRRDDERAGGFIEGSVHVPLHALLERLDELPPAQLWVHCASGFRASIAASLLDRAHHDVVYINDNYSTAVDRHLTTT